jgi:NAD-dependent deacetylase
MDDIELLRELIGSAKRIVAFTGSGISAVEVRTPSPGGIWTRYKPIY